MCTPYFQEAGAQVVGVDVLSRQDEGISSNSDEFRICDLTDMSAVRALMEGRMFDVVFHTAARIYGVLGLHQNPADILIDNSLMTMNLLKCGAGKIRKFVYLSSSMVYERSPVFPHKEKDADESPIMPSAYGLSKYLGERVVRSFHEQYGLVFTIWRPFNIITPFEKSEKIGFSHVFSDLIRKIIVEKQNPLEILGSGEQIRCFSNIYDVADAISRFSLDQRSNNEIFNIGNEEAVTVKQLAELIVTVGQKKGLLPASFKLTYKHLPGALNDVQKRIPDVSKIKKVFGWEAKTKIYQSIEQCINQWFCSGSESKRHE